MHRSSRFLSAAILALSVTLAHAQYSSDFEGPVFSASPGGEPLAGQDGFYVPAGSQVDGRCYHYAGNELGISPNPTGGDQFVACQRSSSDFARAEHAVSFDGADCWFVDLDLNVSHIGPLPTANYAGSVSLQPYPDDGSAVVLFYWDDVRTAETFHIRVLGFDAAGGTPYLAGLPIPDEGFRNLDANRWYRMTIRVEFLAVNAITGVSIFPLDGGPVASFAPFDLQGFHLGGG